MNLSRLPLSSIRWIACVAAAICTLGAVVIMKSEHTSGPSTAIANTSKTNAIFEWRDIRKYSTASLSGELKNLHLLGYNTVYLSINNYIDIYELQNPTERTAQTVIYTRAVGNYIKIASQAGMRVQALSGNKNWSDPELLYLSRAILDFVDTYNTSISPSYRFSGVQFDVEPYNLNGYSQHKTSILEQYVQYIQEVYRYYSTGDSKTIIPIGFTIPFWYDNESDNVEKISVGEAYAFPLYSILDLVKKYDGFVVVMAYRNTIDGIDGVIRHSKSELTYADKLQLKNRLIIAQEISDVTPTKVTYYKPGVTYMHKNINTLYERLQDNVSFGGVAVNDMASLTRQIAKP